MNNFFKTFFACLLAILVSGLVMMILGFVILAGFISLLGSTDHAAQSVRPHSILKIDLAVPIVEKPSVSALDLFDYTDFSFREETTLLELVTLIEKAGMDPNIEGIYLSVPMSIPSSVSTLYEVRRALAEFREQSHKFVVSYADVYSQGGYYLASVGDKVYLNPQGGMDWRGLALNTFFYKGLFDKLGVEPDLIRHGKYKSAGEPFILDRMSAENKEQLGSLAGSMWDFLMGEIASSRALQTDSLQHYASTLAVTSPRRAIALGLVDSLYYRDQMADRLTQLTTQEKEPRLVSLADYKYTVGDGIGNSASANHIAVIYADGDIVDNGDQHRQIVGNEMAATFSRVRGEEKVKAVVFRINSGGGSALASEIIWREVWLTAQQKPVIVSMGSTAASGGYYIACAGDYIVANPTTLTGSIGVFGLTFNLERGAREKLGITSDGVRTNPSADLGNLFRPMTAAERIFVQAGVDSVYARFSQVVAQGRELGVDSVNTLGGGRVWTGAQALQNGLADRVGTLKEAIAVAVEHAGLPAEDFAVYSYPAPVRSSFASLLGVLTTSVAAKISSQTPAPLSEMAAQARELENWMSTQGAVRAAMPYRITIDY